MSDIKRVYCSGSYVNKTHSEISIFREQQFVAMEDDNITGRFVLNEGDFWLDIEGSISDVDSITHDLGNDPFLNSFSTDSSGTSKSRRFDHLYAYYEDEEPMTTK